MGRPSLANERIDEILAAYTRCVGRYGLSGATLEVLAEESGFSRAHIRHYVGNRDELRERFLQHLVAQYGARTRAAVDAAPQGGHSVAIVAHFFGPDFYPNDDNAAIHSVLIAAAHDDALRARLQRNYLDLESLVRRALQRDFPGAPPAAYRTAAYQVFAIAVGHWSLLELDFPLSRGRLAEDGALDCVARVRAAANQTGSRATRQRSS